MRVISKPILLQGIVKQFSGNGRKFGYPTANIDVDLQAEEGIFAGYTQLQGQILPSIIFIGKPITVGETIKRAETHILDFPDQDLYGEHIRIEITAKLRDNMLFDSIDHLLTAMGRDETEARHYFITHPRQEI